MTDFVARPWRKGKYDYEAIIATATNGQAVEVPIEEKNRSGASSNMGVGLTRRGYRLHTSYDRTRQVLSVWCEKLP